MGSAERLRNRDVAPAKQVTIVMQISDVRAMTGAVTAATLGRALLIAPLPAGLELRLIRP